MRGLPETVRERITGASWTPDCPVRLDELAYLEPRHYNFAGEVLQGELIAHLSVAQELLEIFTELFEARYPIHSLRLIEDFDCDDNLSMAANNSYCFCTRPIVGQSELSRHSYGLAIDINPLQNPYQRGERILPSTGEPYLDRNRDLTGMIQEGDPCQQAFAQRGYRWGGNWEKPYVDYHHFEKLSEL